MPAPTDPVANCLAALRTPKQGRVKVVKQALSSGLLSDPVFTSPLVDALSDCSAVFADTLADEVLPQIGQSLLEPLVSGFEELPEPVRYRHLRVVRVLDVAVAQECARGSAFAKHTKLATEAINILAGSEADAAILMALAGSRSGERSYSAYRALAGISRDDVQEFLRESLVLGKGFPEAAIAYHPNEAHSSTLADLLSAGLEPLERGDVPSESEARHLISIIEASVGQNCERFDAILTRCIKAAADYSGGIEPYATFSLNFTEATVEAVATNPVKVAHRSLVQQREQFGPQYQFYALSAAALLDDIPLFETFAPTLAEQNTPGRCRGWKCAWRRRPWPCSIVSAIEYVIALERGSESRGYPLPHQAILIDKIRTEPRWKAALEALAPSK